MLYGHHISKPSNQSQLIPPPPRRTPSPSRSRGQTPNASTSSPRGLIYLFLSYLNSRNLNAVAALFTSSATWIVGPTSISFGGPANARERCALTARLLGTFAQWRFEAVSLTDGTGRVVVEARSRGIGPGTVVYENEHLLRFRVEEMEQGWRIVDLQEIIDGGRFESWLQSMREEGITVADELAG